MTIEQELAALKATVQEIKDRQDIRDCIVRESRARDRQDIAAIEACWWGDGIDEHGAVITGAAEYAAKANMGHKIAMGRYLDRLERRNGEWRMLVRKCTIEMTADCDASWVFSENVKGFLKARWDGQDPCYDRPYVPNNEGLRW